MKTTAITMILFALIIMQSCKQAPQPLDDFWSLASARKSDLQLGVYVTAQTVNEQFSTDAGSREAISVLRCNGISKVYVEVYRCEAPIQPDLLKKTVDLLKKNGFEVIGGIATLPGGGFGVQQQGPLTWMNWQDPKTTADMKMIVEQSAPFFDTFILDDFFCTADTSAESKTAKGDKSWSEYRRSMLTDIAQSTFINPAKAKNPNIKVIIKYPQWYDRFHQFGYDVATEPALFDGVYVGTETRGQYTQRYGFVQPYEGFINYRWISTFAGNKIGAAWFDHGDCNGTDFIEQAYQSVLAGAKELVIFNFGDMLTGHPGHHLLRQDFEKLADLAAAVAKNPIQGTVGYKPANSDAGGDLYLIDYIGMYGVSLVPDSKYPEQAKAIFLPTQAATDSAIVEKAEKSISEGKKVVMTAGFLARAKNGTKLAQLAGIQYPLVPEVTSTQIVLNEGKTDSLKFSLQTDYRIVANGADIMLQTAGKNSVPFFVQNKNIAVINTHTFSQKDFDAVGEVLLCPRQIGLLELPQTWMNTIRSAFQSENVPVLKAPSRVTLQQLSDSSFIIHNYNQEITSVNVSLSQTGNYIDNFTGKPIATEGKEISLQMAPRSRMWFIIEK
jgi:hypothetical protein